MQITVNKRTGEKTFRLYDEDIRPVLFDAYEETNEKLRIFEEFVIGKSRADALMVTETELIGFEIKSDMDSLERLEKQIKNYNRFCDKNYLVVGNKYALKAEEHIPDFWGLCYVFADEEGGLHMEVLREAVQNPRIRLKTQMKFLWRSELISIMKEFKLGGVSKRNKKEMVERILECLEKEEVKTLLCDRLLERDYTIYEEEDR